MKNKKRNRIFLLLILLLGLGIGFAALATTLKINGTTTISKNTWNIYWDNIANQQGETPTTSEIVSEDATHPNNIVNFAVTLNEPGDFYEFTVDAVNAGTLDAELLSIVKKYNNTEIPEVEDPNNRVVPAYLKYEVKYTDGTAVNVGDRLEKAPDLTSNPQVLTRKTYKVRVEYDRETVTNSDVNDQDGNVECTFSLEVQYGQATPIPAAVDFENDSWETIAAEGNRAATQTEVTNNVCGAYHVGDTKTIDMGALGTHTVRIANCSTPSVCSTEGFSETSCGFVVEFADAIGTRRMNPSDSTQNANQPGRFNTGGWEHSEIRAYLNGTTYSSYNGSASFVDEGVIDKLPSDLQDVIKKTKVISGYGVIDASNGNFETEDSLFLLAIHEIYLDSGSGSMKNNAKDWDYTRQLDYYTGSDSGNYGDVNHDGNYLTAKKNGDSNVAWWTRTANSNYYWYFYVVASGGGWRNTENYETANGVSPAFKLK